MGGIAIRADSGAGIGSGHIVRTLTLAAALQARGFSVCFICRDRDGDLGSAIAGAGFGLMKLPRRDSADANASTYGGGLGAPWSEDAAETRAAIGALASRPEWLVVDHYGVDRRWESQVRPDVDRIMAIDDLADRDHDCDLLLDQNLVAEPETRYVGKTPTGCAVLSGPRYALLQPIYAQLHPRMPRRGGPVRSILIYFGGDDHTGLTRRALAATLRACGAGVALDVVLAPNSGIDIHDSAVDSRVTFHPHVNSLAALIARADLAVGAAGATSWERLCLGLPSIVVTRAPNQRPIAAELQRRELAVWLGDEGDVTDAQIERSVRALIESGLDPGWAERCLAVTDGAGTERVCDTMLARDTDALRARHAGPLDEELLLSWANDPETRSNGFVGQPITAQSHRSWFDRRLRNVEGCHLYIVETQRATPVGQVRFERTAAGWEAHYALGPEFRRRGLGRSLLGTALQQLSRDAGSAPVFGRVKLSNKPSLRIFEALGFTAEAETQDVVAFRGNC